MLSADGRAQRGGAVSRDPDVADGGRRRQRDGVLSAGLYSIIHLQVHRPYPVFIIPSQAVIFSQDGLRVAVVSDGKVELRKIELDLDNGAMSKFVGLKPGDQIILSPPANVSDGMRVQEN